MPNNTSSHSLRARTTSVWNRTTVLLPGFLICVTIALASSFISGHYGGPVMLYALLFGIAFHFLFEEGRCIAGIDFSSRTILRLGVALLGARITLNQITELGVGPVVVVIVAVVATIISGRVLSHLLGLNKDLGLLTGGSVAICGASAALALSAVMPRHAQSERNTILTVVGITVMATTAMVLFPLLAGVLSLSDNAAGVFIGGTIHDVAQVVGAGYMVSDEAGEISTVVKLFRVAMLVPAVLAFSLIFRRENASQGEATGKKPPLVPGFLVAFVVMVIINSLGWIPDVVNTGLSSLSGWCLVAAISALGMKTSLKQLADVGWKPVILMAAETAVITVIVLGSVMLMGVGG